MFELLSKIGLVQECDATGA